MAWDVSNEAPCAIVFVDFLSNHCRLFGSSLVDGIPPACLDVPQSPEEPTAEVALRSLWVLGVNEAKPLSERHMPIRAIDKIVKDLKCMQIWEALRGQPEATTIPVRPKLLHN